MTKVHVGLIVTLSNMLKTVRKLKKLREKKSVKGKSKINGLERHISVLGLIFYVVVFSLSTHSTVKFRLDFQNRAKLFLWVTWNFCGFGYMGCFKDFQWKSCFLQRK